MTARPRSQEFPRRVRIRAHGHPCGPDDPRMAAARRAAAPPSTTAAGAVAAIKTSGYQVIVTEHRTRGLVDSDGTADVSPPLSEQQARSRIALLANATAGADGGGPLRQPVAGGRRIIELERKR